MAEESTARIGQADQATRNAGGVFKRAERQIETATCRHRITEPPQGADQKPGVDGTFAWAGMAFAGAGAGFTTVCADAGGDADCQRAMRIFAAARVSLGVRTQRPRAVGEVVFDA